MGSRSRKNKIASVGNARSSRSGQDGSRKKTSKKGKYSFAQLVTGALVVVMILGGLASFFTMLTDNGSVVEIDVTDKKLLKEVFYGGEPWAVLCEETANDKERGFFDKAARKLRDKQIKSGTMNCKDLLPTGENARKRFKLKKSTGDPMIILAANGRKPRQVPKSALQELSVKTFTDYVRRKSQAAFYGPITKKNDWASRCLKSKACVTVYSPKDFSHELRYLHKLALMNRDIQFVYMNSSQYRVAVAGTELDFRSALQGSSMSLFTKEKLAPGEERRMHYFYQEDFDVDSLDAVIQKYKTGRLDMALLEEDAKISMKKRKRRKSKAEREAAAKKKQAAEEKKAAKKNEAEKEKRRRRRARIKADRDAKRAKDAETKHQQARGSADDDDDDADEYEDEYEDEIELGSNYAKWKATEEAKSDGGDGKQVDDSDKSPIDPEAEAEAQRQREARARERMAREQQAFIPEEIPEEDLEDEDDEDEGWMNEDDDDDDDDDEDEIEL